MVRDEADIISPVIDHYIREGVDHIIITDNGSTDGTTEILEGYSRDGAIELHHDPVHRKQQSAVVTQMARKLHADFGVDWVINSDADEFLLPKNRSITLSQAFADIPTEIVSFGVPVVNMVGPLASGGTGLSRLLWRDCRTQDELASSGLRAHPTYNAIHIGSQSVDVAQGNHFVSLASQGAPPPELELEVLHLPWRSWEQYRHRVEVSGMAYLANPEMRPSPNHHGMMDYKRLQDGVLLAYFAARHAAISKLEFSSSFQHESVLKDRYGDHPGLVADTFFDSVTGDLAHAAGLELIERDHALTAAEIEIAHSDELISDLRSTIEHMDATIHRVSSEKATLTTEREELERLVAGFRSRRVVKAADAVSRLIRK